MPPLPWGPVFLPSCLSSSQGTRESYASAWVLAVAAELSTATTLVPSAARKDGHLPTSLPMGMPPRALLKTQRAEQEAPSALHPHPAAVPSSHLLGEAPLGELTLQRAHFQSWEKQFYGLPVLQMKH